MFVTNNATKSRATYVQKFKKLGFEGVEEFDINTSASAAAEHCKQQGYKRAFTVGEVGLREELEMQEVEVVWEEGCEGMSDAGFLAAVEDIKSTTAVDVVVVGWDRNFSYRKLCIASIYLQVGFIFPPISISCFHIRSLPHSLPLPLPLPLQLSLPFPFSPFPWSEGGAACDNQSGFCGSYGSRVHKV